MLTHLQVRAEVNGTTRKFLLYHEQSINTHTHTTHTNTHTCTHTHLYACTHAQTHIFHLFEAQLLGIIAVAVSCQCNVRISVWNVFCGIF